ncbi:ribose 5-phosphate isomerase B [Entomospira culicis]|uniref:Ribose 5-phosphate isomerase B n=1 Tax=Entomospira culicis TaxID=2719989 RepID=A0A968GGC1_9SPIO|nr:ribose 5-phosphate isomerase B [Entomospira culicis]NIZ19785.1 ribose 5-phosphate isomerase B [Entomospira culicis]NIZ69999.1 ribose 5-phosphate isomerase B [Entomospira culicis]WDI37104.1 ribose 5-phosphate isomerase B [Entomospira culicis]WDI38733.1 ribose 5-phosphate isomerase B [Entomospira culicis]
MQIAIGSDHAGYELKNEITKHLEESGYAVQDCGTYSKESCDYPVYGRAVAHKVVHGQCELGIVICGTGVGISLAANKVTGIRAVVCSEPYTAKMARMHNDANILAFGARVVGIDMAKMIVDTWLASTFEGERHAKRIAMIEEDEQKS